jgi:AraC-like DNA-binding protein
MPFFHHPTPTQRLLLFAPPYERTTAIDLGWRPHRFLAGHALVWHVRGVQEYSREFDFVFDRSPELALIVILPPAEEISAVAEAIDYLPVLRPVGVLPTGNTNSPKYYRELLLLRNDSMPSKTIDHLRARNLLPNHATTEQVRRILSYSSDLTSVSSLTRQLRVSRRSLGRRFEALHIPPPSAWLQFGRTLHASLKLQAGGRSVFDIATVLGYTDGFSLSNQMKRLTGHRPTELRRLLGWQWIIEAWVRAQRQRGYFDN